MNIEFEIIVLGLWEKDKKLWKWSWDDSISISHNYNKIKNLQSLVLGTKYDLIKTSKIECDRLTAYMLASVGVHFLNALGMYKIPNKYSEVFAAIIREKINTLSLENNILH